ncbi:MAG TPA: carboxypeptidase-like regulatory domain-containing protein, partial [Anaeromyxobacter sp.]
MKRWIAVAVLVVAVVVIVVLSSRRRAPAPPAGPPARQAAAAAPAAPPPPAVEASPAAPAREAAPHATRGPRLAEAPAPDRVRAAPASPPTRAPARSIAPAPRAAAAPPVLPPARRAPVAASPSVPASPPPPAETARPAPAAPPPAPIETPRERTALTGAVCGVLLDAHGEGIAGATMLAVSSDGVDAAETMTGDDGFFLLAGLRPGRYAIFSGLGTPIAARVASRGADVAPSAVTRVDLSEPGSGATVRVTPRDARGRPAAAQAVLLAGPPRQAGTFGSLLA